MIWITPKLFLRRRYLILFILYITSRLIGTGFSNSYHARSTDLSDRTRVKRSSRYTVKYLVVVDENIRGKFKSRISSSSLSYSDDILKIYYNIILTDIDQRLKSLRNRGLDIAIKGAGLHVLKSSIPGFSLERTHSLKDFIYIDDAKKHFVTWLGKQSGLPDHDHALYLTSYTLGRTARNNEVIETFRDSYKGSICETNSISIVNTKHPAFISLFAAHELGHSLNANDDGAGGCPAGDRKYVMYPKEVFRLETLDMWGYSQCSLTDISSHLASLSRSRKNCLEETSGGSNVNEPYFGKKLTLHDQCRLLTAYSGGVANLALPHFLEEICEWLPCRISWTRWRPFTALSGTFCGHKKWCMYGRCRSYSSAPSVYQVCKDDDLIDCSRMKHDPGRFCVTHFQFCCKTCSEFAVYRINE